MNQKPWFADAGMKILRSLRLFPLLIALSAFAADFGALQPKGYVSDFAGVLDATTIQQINQYCGNVEQATGAQLAIVTINTLEGEPVEDVANLLFRRWGIGKKGEDNGALFLLVIQDRKSRLEVGYGLEPIIPDGFAGSLLRQMRPALQQGDYRTALATATAALGQRIAQEKGVTIGNQPSRRPVQRRDDSGGGGLIILGLIALIWFLSMMGGGGGRRGGGMRGGGVGNILTGMLLGQLLGGGGYRSRGGGGFGGYDSGGGFGGFGGFGGGSSGGGGASSSW